DRANLVLEEGTQWFDQLELKVVRETADVVVALDVRRSGAAAGLDHIGIEGSLDEELDLLSVSSCLSDHFGGGVFEDPDELAADDLALLLGIGHPDQGVQEALLG